MSESMVGQQVRLVVDEGLDTPSHLQGHVGTVVAAISNMEYDVQVAGVHINCAAYHIEPVETQPHAYWADVHKALRCLVCKHTSQVITTDPEGEHQVLQVLFTTADDRVREQLTMAAIALLSYRWPVGSCIIRMWPYGVSVTI